MLINSIANSPQNPQYLSGSTAYTCAETLEGLAEAPDLFADYETRDAVTGKWLPYTKYAFPNNDIDIALKQTVVVPTLDKPRGPMKMLSVAPKKGGLLYKKGFPVKANPSRTYLAYSEDKGETWKTLYGTDPGDGSVKPITTDQLGQEFTNPPIGAVTLKRPGTAIMVR